MKDIQKEIQILIHTYIRSSIMSSHKKKSNKQQEHVDFPCQNRYNKYLQRKEEKTKQSKKEYSYLVVFC
jgi:hypothetical protein